MRVFKVVGVLSLLVLMPSVGLVGQTPLDSFPEKCGTMVRHERMSDFFLPVAPATLPSGVGSNARGTSVFCIPVVVHVVYRNASQNLSQAQIDSQIAVLNEDFRRTNPDAASTLATFQPVAADSEIEFVLATVDPTGAPTTGVTRTSTNVNAFSVANDNVMFTALGGRDAWPTHQYLNIWVAPLQSGLLGYAQFPGGPANTDGVVITSTAFGRLGSAVSPSDLGRTATHEVGHWLNLRHIWGDGPCGTDDSVADTPSSDAPNYGCTLTHVSCGSLDMVQNYMDYSDDACMNLFTAGQKQRMRAEFLPGGRRESLLTSPGLGGAAFQVNQPAASLSILGNHTSGAQPAITQGVVGQALPLALSSNLASPFFDAGVTVAPLVPAVPHGVVTLGHQIVNLPLHSPSLLFANSGGLLPNFIPMPQGTTLNLTFGTPMTLSAQMLVLNAATVDGFSLSQGVEVQVAAAGAPVVFPPGPTTDDGVVSYALVGSNYNLSLPFFGQVYTSMHVSANGRITFAAPNSSFEPTLTSAVAQEPFVGFWTDMDVSMQGSISVTNPGPGLVQVNYTNVPYYAEPFSSITFQVRFDRNSGIVTMTSLQAIGANPMSNAPSSGQSQILGMSAGGSQTVYGGPVTFSVGGSGGPPQPTAMLIDWLAFGGPTGLVASLQGNLQTIDFLPTGSAYTWAGY